MFLDDLEIGVDTPLSWVVNVHIPAKIAKAVPQPFEASSGN